MIPIPRFHDNTARASRCSNQEYRTCLRFRVTGSSTGPSSRAPCCSRRCSRQSSRSSAAYSFRGGGDEMRHRLLHRCRRRSRVRLCGRPLVPGGGPIMMRDHTKVLQIISEQLREVESLRDFITAVAVGARLGGEMLTEMEEKLLICLRDLGTE